MKHLIALLAYMFLAQASGSNAAPAAASAAKEGVAGSKTEHADHDGHQAGETKRAPSKEADRHDDEKEHDEKGHEEEEPWADRVGEGKAVEAFDEAGRLKLAEKAISRMGLKAAPAQAEGPGLRVPLAAVQRSKGKAFIYVAKADRWYERRPATLLSRDRNSALLSAKVAKNELVVTEGSASLRAAELDLLAGESAGHGH